MCWPLSTTIRRPTPSYIYNFPQRLLISICRLHYMLWIFAVSLLFLSEGSCRPAYLLASGTSKSATTPEVDANRVENHEDHQNPVIKNTTRAVEVETKNRTSRERGEQEGKSIDVVRSPREKMASSSLPKFTQPVAASNGVTTDDVLGTAPSNKPVRTPPVQCATSSSTASGGTSSTSPSSSIADDVVVFCDYDATMTTRWVNTIIPSASSPTSASSASTTSSSREKGLTAVQVVEHWSKFPQQYLQESRSRHRHYFAIENDATLSIEQKLPHMIRWYEETIEDLIKYARTPEVQLRKKDLPEMVAEHLRAGRIQLREGMKELVELLFEKGVPFVIISAGFADVIREVLRQFGIPPHKYVLWSNEFEFEEGSLEREGGDGLLRNVKPPLLHMYNKQLEVEEDADKTKKKNPNVPGVVWEAIGCRRTAISIGDSLGDAEMGNYSQQFGSQIKERLKLGLLNYNEEELREKYEAAFDVVFAGDADSFGILNCVETVLQGRVKVAEVVREVSGEVGGCRSGAAGGDEEEEEQGLMGCGSGGPGSGAPGSRGSGEEKTIKGEEEEAAGEQEKEELTQSPGGPTFVEVAGAKLGNKRKCRSPCDWGEAFRKLNEDETDFHRGIQRPVTTGPFGGVKGAQKSK